MTYAGRQIAFHDLQLCFSSAVLLIDANYKDTQTYTGLATYQPWLRNADTHDKIFEVLSHDVVIKTEHPAVMCVLACLFLIIDEIIFRGNTLGSGHGSSDFPRLECVAEHGADVFVCVCVC